MKKKYIESLNHEKNLMVPVKLESII